MAHGGKNYFNGRYEVERHLLDSYLSHTGVLCVVFQFMPIDARDQEKQSTPFMPVASIWLENLLCFKSWHRGHKNYVLKYLMSWCHLMTVSENAAWTHQTEYQKRQKISTTWVKFSKKNKKFWSSLCHHFGSVWYSLTPGKSKNGQTLGLQTYWTSSLKLAESTPSKQLRAGWLQLCTNVCLKRSELHNNVIIIVMKG